MQIWILLCNILAAILGSLFLYRVALGIAGFFVCKKFPEAKVLHRYGIVISARNEEAVIGNLLGSIAAQDYPRELLRVFVVADGCSDRTAEVARSYGAVCYERQADPLHATKGYALEFLFAHLAKREDFASLEGFFILDADNLLKRDFIRKMNDAFDAGYPVVTSYRNTKNWEDGWLAASYAQHWMRTARMEHRGASYWDISARIQGTGFLFHRKYVENGWHYTSLTEDRAFTSHVVASGDIITYQEAAEFYDEQPTSLRIALRQRLRWAKGNLQAFAETFRALLRGTLHQATFRKRFSCYHTFTYNFPSAVATVPLKWIEAGLVVALALSMTVPNWQGWLLLLWRVVEILVFEHFSCILLGLLLFASERKRLPKLSLARRLWYALWFPTFGIIGDIVTVSALFLKVQWKPIPHRASLRLEEVEASMGKEQRPMPPRDRGA